MSSYHFVVHKSLKNFYVSGFYSAWTGLCVIHFWTKPFALALIPPMNKNFGYKLCNILWIHLLKIKRGVLKTCIALNFVVCILYFCVSDTAWPSLQILVNAWASLVALKSTIVVVQQHLYYQKTEDNSIVVTRRPVINSCNSPNK